MLSNPPIFANVDPFYPFRCSHSTLKNAIPLRTSTLWNTSCDPPPTPSLLLSSILFVLYTATIISSTPAAPLFSSFHGHFALSEIFLLVLGSCTPTSFPPDENCSFPLRGVFEHTHTHRTSSSKPVSQ